MSTTHRTNATKHHEVTASNGETWVEKNRDTMGGWANMVARVAKRLGGTDLRCLADPHDKAAWANPERVRWLVKGTDTTVTFREVNVL